MKQFTVSMTSSRRHFNLHRVIKYSFKELSFIITIVRQSFKWCIQKWTLYTHEYALVVISLFPYTNCKV